MPCVYIDAIIVLVKCCNSKSQVLNKNSFVQSFVQQSSVKASANSTNISYIIILVGIFLILIFLLTRSPKLKISNNLQSLSVVYVKIFMCV